VGFAHGRDHQDREPGARSFRRNRLANGEGRSTFGEHSDSAGIGSGFSCMARACPYGRPPHIPPKTSYSRKATTRLVALSGCLHISRSRASARKCSVFSGSRNVMTKPAFADYHELLLAKLVYLQGALAATHRIRVTAIRQ